jgi:hypothetical protein
MDLERFPQILSGYLILLLPSHTNYALYIEGNTRLAGQHHSHSAVALQVLETEMELKT